MWNGISRSVTPTKGRTYTNKKTRRKDGYVIRDCYVNMAALLRTGTQNNVPERWLSTLFHLVASVPDTWTWQVKRNYTKISPLSQLKTLSIPNSTLKIHKINCSNIYSSFFFQYLEIEDRLDTFSGKLLSDIGTIDDSKPSYIYMTNE